jgi:hypothetical protein
MQRLCSAHQDIATRNLRTVIPRHCGALPSRTLLAQAQEVRRYTSKHIAKSPAHYPGLKCAHTLCTLRRSTCWHSQHTFARKPCNTRVTYMRYLATQILVPIGCVDVQPALKATAPEQLSKSANRLPAALRARPFSPARVRGVAPSPPLVPGWLAACHSASLRRQDSSRRLNRTPCGSTGWKKNYKRLA